MTKQLFLGIDLGTSSVKAIVVGIDGVALGIGSASHPTSYPKPNRAEQDPFQWWRATVEATQSALVQAGSESSRSIAAIGVTGQMHGTVLLDDADIPIAPAIIWSDGRSGVEVDALTAEIGAERVIAITGSPLASGFQAATVRWIHDHRPDLWQRVRRVTTPKDYIRWRLTSEHATDPSDASGTLLFDVRGRAWDDELLRAAGLDRNMAPLVRASSSIAGTLMAVPAAELGLNAGIPVAAGGADAPCAALGSGVVTDDSLLLTFSTGAQALLPRIEVAVDTRGRLHTFCSVLDPDGVGPGWYTMGATLAAGMALSWLRDSVFALESPDPTAEMLSWAQDVPAGSRGLVSLPYLVGERTPHMDPSARGVYLGLTSRHGRGDLVRATLEGIAFAAYDAFLALQSLGAAPVQIVAAGGGARNPLWRQIVADLFELPVFPLVGEEQTAIGAAILAGTAIGSLDPVDAAGSWAKHGPPSLPSAGASAQYADLFAVFQRTYQHLKDDMAFLGEIESRTDR